MSREKIDFLKQFKMNTVDLEKRMTLTQEQKETLTASYWEVVSKYGTEYLNFTSEMIPPKYVIKNLPKTLKLIEKSHEFPCFWKRIEDLDDGISDDEWKFELYDKFVSDFLTIKDDYQIKKDICKNKKVIKYGLDGFLIVPGTL